MIWLLKPGILPQPKKKKSTSEQLPRTTRTTNKHCTSTTWPTLQILHGLLHQTEIPEPHVNGTMSSPLEGPNPLRPYYVPPSIGLPSSELPKAAPHVSASATSGNITSFGNSARDIFSDFDYSDYLGDQSPSVLESARQLLEAGTWRYSRIVMSQPFEVAKTILQVYVAQDADEEARILDERRHYDRAQREDYQESVRHVSRNTLDCIDY